MSDHKYKKIASQEYVWQIQVRTEAHLDYWIRDYLGGLKINHERDGNTTLTGKLPDMSAVYGLVLQLRDAGITLLSLQVERTQCDSIL